MPVAKFALPGPSTMVKMEDRKRPVSGSDDLAPPSKRQAINGGGKSREDNESKEEAWVEEFQKDAIYRQMQEYKREKAALETRLGDLEQNAADHDDHLRMIDAWWLQLVQEVSQLAGEKIPFQPDLEASQFLSALEFKDFQAFKDHLAQKSTAIKSTLDGLFSRLASCRGTVTSDKSELEAKVNSLLATQKEFMVKLDKFQTEKENLTQDLNNATLRYYKAERKLDRAKSAQVQRLEQQALAQSTGRPAPANGVETAEQSATDEETLLAYNEAKAACEKQKEQIEKIEAQNKSLQEDLTALQTRLASLSDEDYSRTEVFKQFKSQNDDLIKRINNLEATNKQSRDEAEKLKGERTAFQRQLETEAQTLTNEYEDQIRARDTDISRIRSARDDMYAEIQMRKQRDEQERIALDQLKELVDSKQDRITALEAQLETIRPSGESPTPDSTSDFASMSLEQLQEKYRKMDNDLRMANNELRPMEEAYKKTWALAHKKVLDFSAMEEKVASAREDKMKSDHRYFAARKDMDTRSQELKALRIQNSKSSDIIAQLKEVESSNKVLTQNLEKQLYDLRQSNTTTIAENKKMERLSTEAQKRADVLKSQVAELSTLLKVKDSAYSEEKQRVSSLEVELEKARTRLEQIQKDRDSWKTKCLSNSSEEEQMLRQFALCTICRATFKDTFLRTCGHLFCKKCVDDRIMNRMRKCPTCSKPFDKLDVMTAHF
ncbi:hypothetical protein MKZ38_002756 [Zalerion maritima]|uniref:E3 ubiquitin protein ligase n=1 Tax=Zalerion maritima TaxID=339359 RepID=A0AAD5WS69_9PEZI|nr:hypothetical protein MKZ38_002756 [Zalerion maritima]